MAEKVPSWLERILLPQIREVKGELKGLNGRMDALEGRMEGEFSAVHSEIRRLDEKIAVEIKRMDERMSGLENTLKLGDRISAVENRVTTLEARK